MKKVKIPKNRIRKLKTFSLGKKSFELLSSNSQNKKLIDLCSNDYFGLSRDKDLIKAAYEISMLEGIGSGSSRFITGSRPYITYWKQNLQSGLIRRKYYFSQADFKQI